MNLKVFNQIKRFVRPQALYRRPDYEPVEEVVRGAIRGRISQRLFDYETRVTVELMRPLL